MAKAKLGKNIQIKDKIISCTAESRPKIEKSLGTFIFERMLKNGNSTAQIDGLTGETNTYNQVLQRCIRTAIAMRARGIAREHTIVICSYNHMHTFDPIFATQFLGAKIACLDPRLSLEDTVHLLAQVHPKMLFVSTDAVDLIQNALKKINTDVEVVVFGKSEHCTPYSQFVEAQMGESDFKPVEIDNVKDTAMIVFSSGTTGKPKGICLSHSGLIGSWCLSEYPNSLVGMGFASPYWISSHVLLLMSVFSSSTRVVLPEFKPENVWNLIRDYKVNVLQLSASQWVALSKGGRPEDADTSSLLFGTVNGAPLSSAQMMKLNKLFPNVALVNPYGLSELNGGGLLLDITNDPIDIKLWKKQPNCLGRPVPGFTYKVVDPDTEELLGPNQPGELRVKTELQMNGYFNLDSSLAWDSDGFVKTGDLVYYDEDFGFYYVDRIKEMLKYQSWQIAPIKLEEILMTHPQVGAAVVIGLPHPDDGDHPMALVVLRKGIKENVTAKVLQQYLDERVGDREKLRGGLKIVDSLPRTPTEKFDRKRIKRMVLHGNM